MSEDQGDRPPRRRTGDPALDQALLDLLRNRVTSREDRDLLFEMLTTVLRLAGDDVDRLDLKITNAALKEMRQAFRVFAPFHDVPKVTIFGSARTLPEDPLYTQARDLAAALAEAGWMVVTGAGPGIMAAGAEGAGRERSIGVNIRLPFEQDANPFIAADPKLVSMKYFFTRKLMLMKESAGFVVLPGGFGTLDEMFELLTLLQTGKAAPAPIVLLDVPGGTYWQAWARLIRDELAARGLVDEHDLGLVCMTSEVAAAVAEVLGFYRNYHSIRYVGARLVMRLRAQPTAEEVAQLNRDFADICVDGGINVSGPLPAEVADDDHVKLARLVFSFDRMSHGRLRGLIDAVNRLPSAPPLARPDPASALAAGSPPDTGGAPAPVAPDPALAELLARVARDDRQAVRGLREILATGGLSTDQQDAVVSELCRLALTTSDPSVRAAILDAVGASSPFVCLDPLLELLIEHRDSLGEDGASALLAVLDRVLAAAEVGSNRRQVAQLLRLEDPRPALDALAGSSVGAQARALKYRVESLTG